MRYFLYTVIAVLFITIIITDIRRKEVPPPLSIIALLLALYTNPIFILPSIIAPMYFKGFPNDLRIALSGTAIISQSNHLLLTFGIILLSTVLFEKHKEKSPPFAPFVYIPSLITILLIFF